MPRLHGSQKSPILQIYHLRKARPRFWLQTTATLSTVSTGSNLMKNYLLVGRQDRITFQPLCSEFSAVRDDRSPLQNYVASSPIFLSDTRERPVCALRNNCFLRSGHCGGMMARPGGHIECSVLPHASLTDKLFAD